MSTEVVYNFHGKRALVTGAGRGLGAEVARALWSAGAEVYALDKLKENLDSIVAECPGIHAVCADLSDWDITQQAVDTTLPIDLLVNNAGTALSKTVLDVTAAAFDEVFSVNVKAVAAVTQVVVRDMIVRHCHGSVVNVSSGASKFPMSNSLVYCTSKGALDQLTRCMALDLGPHQIRVNSVNPGLIVNTDMGRSFHATAEDAEPLRQRTLLKKLSETQQITDAILYLLSDRASMVTGCFLPVDGGVTIAALYFPDSKHN